VSILGATTPSKGEGGGVCSNAPCLPARAIKNLSDGSGDIEVEPCDLLAFFDKGSSCDLEMEGERREEFGNWMPKDGRDSDFRRVLYGIVRE
jgi:hypothetical protein